MILYYITDRSQFAGDESSRRAQLFTSMVQAAHCGVDYIQLREKDISPRELEILAGTAVRSLRTENQKLKTVLLINSRTDIALACGAQGLHLPSHDISPSDVRKIWTLGGGSPAQVTVGISCHTRSEVARAAREGSDFAVFGPVFEKEKSPARPAGLEALGDACQEKIPVLALGGVTLENAESCLQAGAAGVAGIRLFQEDEMAVVVAALRRLKTNMEPGGAAGQLVPKLNSGA